MPRAPVEPVLGRKYWQCPLCKALQEPGFPACSRSGCGFSRLNPKGELLELPLVEVKQPPRAMSPKKLEIPGLASASQMPGTGDAEMGEREEQTPSDIVMASPVPGSGPPDPSPGSGVQRVSVTPSERSVSAESLSPLPSERGEREAVDVVYQAGDDEGSDVSPKPRAAFKLLKAEPGVKAPEGDDVNDVWQTAQRKVEQERPPPTVEPPPAAAADRPARPIYRTRWGCFNCGFEGHQCQGLPT